MSGDFSRNTFKPKTAFSGVLMQQGRVELDADWNEQDASTLPGKLRKLSVSIRKGASRSKVLIAGSSRKKRCAAAQVLAKELHLELYRVDLSTVVSKYIGETEKNISRIFDAAEKGNTMLFLDEADALFGKRTEVKDSHDRYANIEVSYLLQRIENFEGVAILATNNCEKIDPASLRHFNWIISFRDGGPAPTGASKKKRRTTP